MRIRVLGGEGGGLLSDVQVFLVGNAGSPSANILRTAFPATSKVSESGAVEYAIKPGPGSSKIVDAVEIESPTLTVLLVGVAVLIVGLVIALFVKK